MQYASLMKEKMYRVFGSIGSSGLMPVAVIMLHLCLFPAGVHAEVYTNYFTPSSPKPEPFSIGLGDTFQSVLVDNQSEITMTGGSILAVNLPFTRSALRLVEQSKAYIYDGLLRVRDDDHNGFGLMHPLFLENGSQATIYGGTFESYGSSSHAAQITKWSKVVIEGGTFIAHDTDALYLWQDGEVIIKGGTFTTDSTNPLTVELYIRDGSAEVHAKEILLDGIPITPGPITQSMGVLTITYADDSVESASYRIGSSGSVKYVLVPEPTSSILLMLLLMRRIGWRSNVV